MSKVSSPSPSAEFLTTQQLAEKMGISVWLVQKLSAREDCPVVKSEFTTRNLFNYEEFKNWFCNSRREATGKRGKHVKMTKTKKEVSNA